jgi:hypothetical protein
MKIKKMYIIENKNMGEMRPQMKKMMSIKKQVGNVLNYNYASWMSM